MPAKRCETLDPKLQGSGSMRDPTTGKPLMYLENEQIAEYRAMGFNKGAFAQVTIGHCANCKYWNGRKCKETGRAISKKLAIHANCNWYAERKA